MSTLNDPRAPVPMSHPATAWLVRVVRAMAVCACLLVTFSLIWAKMTRRVHVFVFRVEGAAQSPAEVARILDRRAKALARSFRAVRAEAEPGDGTVAIRVTTSFDPRPLVDCITRPGVAELRLAYPDPEWLPRNRDAPPPDGYEIKTLSETEYLLGSPGETQQVKIPHLVQDRAELRLTRLRRAAYTAEGLDRAVNLDLELEPEDAASFSRLTAGNVGRMMGLLIDGELCAVARISQAVEGREVRVRGYFHLPTVRIWAALLDSGALTAALTPIGRPAARESAPPAPPSPTGPAPR